MNVLQIGVTGGIGSGKSLVCRIFNCLGIPVYDADSHARKLMNNDPLLTQQIREEFGEESYDRDGNLNRKYLAERVFNRPDQLQKLNHFVHPRVADDYASWVRDNSSASYVIKEAALLFESGSAKGLNKIIAVYAPEELRMKRVLKRDTHRNKQAVLAVMHNQMNEEDKRNKADFVISNDDKTLIIPQVLQLHSRFIRGQESLIH